MNTEVGMDPEIGKYDKKGIGKIIYLFPLFFGLVMLGIIMLPVFLTFSFVSQIFPFPLNLIVIVLPFSYLPSFVVLLKLREQEEDRLRWLLWICVPLVGPYLYRRAHRPAELTVIPGGSK